MFTQPEKRTGKETGCEIIKGDLFHFGKFSGKFVGNCVSSGNYSSVNKASYNAIQLACLDEDLSILLLKLWEHFILITHNWQHNHKLQVFQYSEMNVNCSIAFIESRVAYL